MKWDITERDTEEGRSALYNTLREKILQAIHVSTVQTTHARIEPGEYEDFKDGLECVWRWAEVGVLLEEVGKPKAIMESLMMQAACDYMDLTEFDRPLQDLDLHLFGICAVDVCGMLSNIKLLREYEVCTQKKAEA